MDKKAYKVITEMIPRSTQFVIRTEEKGVYLVRVLGTSEIYSFNNIAGEVLLEINGKRNLREIIFNLHLKYSDTLIQEIGMDTLDICRKFEEKGVISFVKINK